jgi:tRNA 2-thiouridine synthesizing protein A
MQGKVMNPASIKADKILDARGMSCPIPLLKTKKILKNMRQGQILHILGTDPGSKQDLPGIGIKNGNVFLGMLDNEDGSTSYFIKKGAA